MRIALDLILDDGAILAVGTWHVVTQGRRGLRDFGAGALQMPRESVEAAWPAVCGAMTGGAARTWRLTDSDGQAFRGRYFVDTLMRAGESNIAELALAGTGEEPTPEPAP